MIVAHEAKETHIISDDEYYPRRVVKGALIGRFESIHALYQYLTSELRVTGPRVLEALWGERGYIRVSSYAGEDFAQDAAGRRITRLCD